MDTCSDDDSSRVHRSGLCAAALETPALLREIFCFAYAPALVPINAAADSAFAMRFTEPSTAGLHTLAQVCSTWQRVAHALLARFAMREHTLQFTIGNEEAEQRVHAAYLRTHGHTVLHLHIFVGPPKQQLWWAALGAADASLQSQSVDWHTLFAAIPHLQRLDLSHVPLHHFTLADILTASSTHCLDIQSLVLPKRDPNHSDAVDASIDATFTALYAALQRWHVATGANCSRNGLRQLTVPSQSAFEPTTTSTAFLAAVTHACPQIEYIDGWKRTYCAKRFVRCDQSWSVDACDTWTHFCAACTHLREFSWVVVPFADAFFRPFGSYPKRQLTHLQLTYNAAAPFRILRSAYSSKGLCALLHGCPALVVLDVVLHRVQTAQALVYPHLDEMIDGAVFDDRFLVALTQQCRRLERLCIRAVDGRFPLLGAITDVGLEAVAQLLPRLQQVELLSAACSAPALWRLLLESVDSVASRSVRICELGTQFSAVATALLQTICCVDRSDADEDNSVALRLARVQHKPLLLSIACRRGAVMQRSMLIAAHKQLTHGNARVQFVAVVVDKPTRRHERDGFVRMPTSATSTRLGIGSQQLATRDVVRIGELVVFTDRKLLRTDVRAACERRGDRDACVIEL